MLDHDWTSLFPTMRPNLMQFLQREQHCSELPQLAGNKRQRFVVRLPDFCLSHVHHRTGNSPLLIGSNQLPFIILRLLDAVYGYI
jgi:hypothetical protein